jgi:RNA polymerase sigma factor (sigma-70 family)
MARASGSLLRHLHRLAVTPVGPEPSDRQLLRHYAVSRDEAVFEVLVRRHATLVWGVCRRLLAEEHDAEDAFQATFLVLLRKAGAVRFQESVAGWLHAVACRVARKARVAAARRRWHESRAEARPVSDPFAAALGHDLRHVLDEELGRLPAKYRAPVVLCLLKGLTHAEAARRLGWPEGTVSGRLARAREKLRTRLAGRGVVLSVGALTAALANRAAGPPAVVAAAQRLAAAYALGEATAGSPAVALAQGVLRAMLLARLTAVTAVALVVLTAAALGYRLVASGSQPESPSAPVTEPASGNQQPQADLFGDPLPPGALVRMGTIRLRQPYPQVVFPPDGKTLISVNTDLLVRTWDLGTGKFLHERRLEGTQDLALSDLAFAPDGTALTGCEASNHETLFVYQVPTGKQLSSISVGAKVQLNRAALAPGGKAVAAALNDLAKGRRLIRLWDLATGEERQLLEHDDFDQDLAFSPDGKLLGAAGRDHALRLWDVATGKLLHALPVDAQRLAFSPTGQMVASGGFGGGGTLILWDVATGKEQASLRGIAVGAIQALAFSPDNKLIAAGGPAGLGLWDVAARKELYRRGHKDRWADNRDGLLWLADQTVNELMFAPDGKTLAACGGSTIRLWDVADGKELLHRAGHDEDVDSITVSRDGRIVASTSSSDGTLCLWDGSTGRLLQQPPGHDSAGVAPSLSSDGRLVASGRHDGFVYLWETATGKERRRFPCRDLQPENVVPLVLAVRLSPDGKRLVTLTREDGGRQCHIAVWDTASGKLLKHRPFEGDGGDGGSSLTPDANGVTVRVEDGLAIEETATGKRLVTFSGVEDLLPIAFSPNGELVAVVRRGPVIGLALRGAKGEVEAVSLADTTTGQEVLHLETGLVEHLAFSPDGRVLATADHGIVRLWEVATGKEIFTQRPHPPLRGAPAQAGVTSVALLAGGRGLLTGLTDGTILMWNITPDRPAVNDPEHLWTDLAADDARTAYRAVHALAASPARTIAYLKQHLRPVPELVDPKRVAQLIADLDSDEFEVREKATKELEKLGELAEPALRQGLKGEPSVEVGKRLERLLAPHRVPTGEVLRVLRAIWVLEQIGTVEARQLLQKLASGAMAPQTRAAQEALERLEPGL